jgi:ubiquinone biosynthesis protein
MRIGLLRRYEEIQRLHQIVDVLIKHGLGYLAKRIELHSLIPFRKRIFGPKQVEVEPLPVTARKILEELGPTFIKFGQILSSRPDLIPREYVVEFSKLLDRVPPFSYEEVEKQIENELGAPISELFDFFDKKPFASASIGQVHVACLKTGEKVVVKIQRPGIEDIIESDINVLYTLAKLVERHLPETRPYDPTGIVREFAKTIRKELDYTREARNAEKFQRNFKEIEYIRIPKVYREYTSRRVLTLEYLEGIKLGDIEELERRGYDRKRIAENLAKSFLKQVYVDGFFQGDPHPANILVLEDESLGFIDFGMIGRLDKDLMNKLADIFIAVVRKDIDKVVKGYLEIGIIDVSTDIQDFKLDAQELIEHYYGVPIKEIDTTALMKEIMDMAMEYRIRIPSNFSLFIKSLATVESVARQLDPEFNLSVVAEPFVKEMVKSRIHPKVIASEFLKSVSELGESAITIPKKVERVLEKVEKDQLVLEHRGFDRFISELNATGNRISLALIVSAIIVSSALIMQTGKGPLFLGLPFFSLLGFTIAGILGAILVITIVRSGRL